MEREWLDQHSCRWGPRWRLGDLTIQGALMAGDDRRTRVGGVFLNCPRCGLSIRRRVESLAFEHCPRCVGRAGIPVPLIVSARPPVSWHRDSRALASEQPSRHGRGGEGSR